MRKRDPRFRALAAVALAAFLAGCVSASSRWIGKTSNELMVALGPPTETVSDGGSGSILIYDRRSAPIPGQLIYDSFGRPVAETQASQGSGMRESFYVREDGTIYAYKRETTL